MNNIKYLREKYTNLNQKEFADWLEVPLRTVQAWEEGGRNIKPYVERLIELKIECYFGTEEVPAHPYFVWLQNYFKNNVDKLC